ncbi:hypothetical protein J6590_078538 [Homalodisca vitripennis]|nr:hypothetical protein J6590_078538 [Homalodisca vitripennis]
MFFVFSQKCGKALPKSALVDRDISDRYCTDFRSRPRLLQLLQCHIMLKMPLTILTPHFWRKKKYILRDSIQIQAQIMRALVKINTRIENGRANKHLTSRKATGRLSARQYTSLALRKPMNIWPPAILSLEQEP